MLHEFIAENRDLIIARTRKQVEARKWPLVSSDELQYGVPLFLTQLTETLRMEGTDTPFPETAIGDIAARHGSELLDMGLTVSQVVHDYGDICQAVTGLAIERHASITVEEFHTLNRSLDTAIAEAVTEYLRRSALAQSAHSAEHLGRVAHEIRDLLNTALLAFHMLRRGAVALNGGTGAMLARSLMSLQSFVNGHLSEVRLAAGTQRPEKIRVMTLLDDIAAAGMLHSDDRHIQFTLEPVDPSLSVFGDRQLLASAVMNLLNNAFKYTVAGGQVILRAHAREGQLAIEVEDGCGGMPESQGDWFQPFGERRGSDRSGLGLGLSMARQGVRAQGGEIRIRNTPGKGCVFVVELPLAEALEPTPVGAVQ